MSENVVAEVERIEATPLNQRAEAYSELYQTLVTQLEQVDSAESSA